jgi:hypothetical protein
LAEHTLLPSDIRINHAFVIDPEEEGTPSGITYLFIGSVSYAKMFTKWQKLQHF